jgi:predicted dithiol-disulfide oxidoreductase (DUF899 family)
MNESGPAWSFVIRAASPLFPPLEESAMPARHQKHFPNESRSYRTARNALLDAEVALQKQVVAVAGMRQRLPLGGVVEDYTFEETGRGGKLRRVKLSQLFARGKDTLLLYSFMFGPKMKKPCPMCSSFLDGINGNAPHILQRANLAVVARSPIARIRAFARERGWDHLRLLSSAGNTYSQDYHGEAADGDQVPMMNVFTKSADGIRHFYASEAVFAPESGHDPCHLDLMWPLWNVLDLTPEGRGDWYPGLNAGR